MSLWVFDIDGVIVDTKELVLKAYEEAGCPMPDDKFGVHWTHWMPEALGGSTLKAMAIHDLKTQIYLDLLKTTRPRTLPGYVMAECLMRQSHGVYFVTSMAEPAADAIMDMLGFDSCKVVGVTLRGDERATVLRSIKRMWPRAETSFIYVDDRIEGADIAASAGYGFMHADWNNE